jgi:hypothetical protein
MTPPMGGNSWNAFHGDIEEKILTGNETQG